ncbi:hypothetical protein JMN32_10345 [Fulvivirga sp. 29W222]|uniref:Uncharacterized protein n=1 Tax=Fulvivirga marina TaxID=2494733 RepID=A0A937FX96_9BACT|nr:hypothetical protein [Fulvivirga marina]MBL6446713.1 hypothetical protein [Fulvivirga marina]
MLSRINIGKIIIDHFRTLRRLGSKSKKIYFWDFILFIVLPILIAAISIFLDFDLSKHVNNLIAAISIFGGFLFNLLAIIYSQIDKIRTDADFEDNELKKVFVKEIHINISFNIVLSIFLVLTLLLYSAEFNFGYGYIYLKQSLLAINCFLLVLFGLTLLMVLNRVHILLKKDLETKKN